MNLFSYPGLRPVAGMYGLLALMLFPWKGNGQGGAGLVPLGEAVDAPALSWRTGPEAPWFGHPLESHDGVDAARSGGEETGTSSWIETTVTGPVLISFQAKNQSGTLSAQVDGAEAWSTFDTIWKQTGVTVQEGVHTVRWSRLLEPYYSTANGTASYLDEVSVQPLTAVTPGEAMDATTGIGGWRSAGGLVFGVAGAGESLAKGGDYLVVRSLGGAYLEADVAGPARVSFRWRTLAGTEPLTVGTEVARMLAFPPAAAGAWQESVVDIPHGQRVLSFRTAGSAGDLLLDALSVTPGRTTSVALGSGNLVWSGDWVTRFHVSALGGSVASSGIMGRQVVNPLTTTVTGPAEVRVVSALLYGSDSGWNASGAVPVTLNGSVTGLAKPLAEGWVQTTVFVPEGTHELGLRPTTTTTATSDGVLVESVVDMVSVTSLSSMGVSAALDGLPGAAVVASGAGASRWRGFESVTGARNNSAAVCGPLAAGGTEDLSVSVTGPGTLLFSMRAEALPATPEPTLTVLVDGSTAAILPGPAAIATLTFNPNLTPWRIRQVSLPAGDHTVVFRASVGTAAGAGQALFWLDSLAMLTSDSGPSSLGSATGFTGATWTRTKTGTGSGWQKMTTPAADEDRQYAACPAPMALGDMAEMTAAFSGPGTLRFRWNQADTATLSCLVDGVEQIAAWNLADGAGAEAALLIPPGLHQVSWKLVRTAPVDGNDSPANAVLGWVDGISLTPPPTVSGTLADAVDAPASTADTSPVWPWHHRFISFSPATAAGGPVDGDAAFVEVPRSGESWMELPVQGPGRFGYWWRADTGGQDQLSLLVDGVKVDTKTGYDGELWQRVEVSLTPGTHLLRWQVASGNTGEANAIVLREDAARRFWVTGWQALPEVPLAEAMDASGFPWSAGAAPVGSAGGLSWSGIASGDSTNGFPDDAAFTKSSRPLTTTVTGPGRVTFQWTISPAPRIEIRQPRPAPVQAVAAGGYHLSAGSTWVSGIDNQPAGSALFAVDGVDAARLYFSAVSNSPLPAVIRTVNVPVGPGVHILTWHRPAAAGTQRLMVDRFAFTPQDHTPLASALGLPGEVLQTTGGPDWTVQSAVTHDGVSALQSGGAADGETSGFQILINGPGELTYWWRGDLGSGTEAVASATKELAGPLVDWIGSSYPWSGQTGPTVFRTTDFAWEQRRVVFGFGRHRMKWSLQQKSGPPRRLWVDDVVFTPAAVSSGPEALAEALDINGLTWSASPGWQRYQIKLDDVPTDDLVAGPSLSAGDEAWMETTVAGPVKLEFWWDMREWYSISGSYDSKAPDIFMDGSAITPLAGYKTREFDIPSGMHTVRIRFTGITGAVYRPLLDRVRRVIPLGEALDQPGLTWTVSAGEDWHGRWVGWNSTEEPGREDFAGFVTSTSSFRSLTTQATGMGIQFEVKRNFDLPEGPTATLPQNRLPRLRVIVDGVVLWDSAGLPAGWTPVTLPLGGTLQKIIWDYTPGGIETVGQTTFMLDQVAILTTPVSLPGLADSLDTPSRLWAGSWLPVRQNYNPVHDDFATASLNTDFLTTMVTGPGWIQFDHRTGSRDLAFSIGASSTRHTNQYLPMSVWLSSPRIFIPRGNHFLEWRTWTNSAFRSPVELPALDTFRLDPLTETSVAAGLDSNLAWINSGGLAGAGWHGIPLADAVGGDAVAVTLSSTTAELATNVTGPCLVEVRWRSEGTSSYNGPALQLVAPSGQHFPARNAGAWTVSSCVLPAGSHPVRLTSTGTATFDAFTLLADQFSVTPSITLAAALNLPALQPASQGTVNGRQFADGRTDVLLAASPSQTNLNILSAEVTGPGELVFEFKVEGTSFSSNGRRFTVDGIEAGQWIYSRAPTARLALSAGPHTLRWIAGSAAVSVGSVSWTPGLPAWTNGLWGSGPGVTGWLTGSDGPWTAAPGEGIPGYPDAGKSVPGTYGWIQPILSGAGTLTFWERTARETNNPLTQATALVTGEWRFLRELQPAASPARIWLSEPGTVSWLAGFHFTPAVSVPLSEALDGSALTWLTSPAGSWAGFKVPATEGASAAQALTPVQGSPSVLKTTVTGPGTLRYSWRTLASGAPADPFSASFSLNGLPVSLETTNGVWRSVDKWIGGSGAQEFKWQADRIPAGMSLWVDAVQFTPATPSSLTDSLDLAGAAWTTGGTALWTGLGNVPGTNNGDLATLNAVGPNGNAWVETTVAGSGELRFRWGFPDQNHGVLEWELDGIVRSTLKADVVWEDEIHALPPGPHTLRWRYRTLANQTVGTGGAWLDTVSFTPGNPAANWGAAVGQPGLTWSGGGSALWNSGMASTLQATLNRDQRHIHAAVLIPGPAWVDFLTAEETFPVSTLLDGQPVVMLPGKLPPLTGPPIIGPPRFISATRAGTFFVPPGQHLASWEFFRSRSTEWMTTATMEKVNVVPVTGVPLGEALDLTNITITTDATLPWQGVTDTAPGGDDYAWLGLLGDQQSSLNFTTATPGQLTVKWDATSVSQFSSTVSLLVDNTRFSPTFTPQTSTLTIGPGEHKITGDNLYNTSPAGLRIYAVTFTPWNTVPLDEAGDAPGRSFTSGGPGWWTGLVSPALAQEGTSLIHGQPLSEYADQPTWLETTVTGPAEVSFWWRVETNHYNTSFYFSTASLGTVKLNPSSTASSNAPGPPSSGLHRVTLGAGTHTLRWAISGTLSSVQLDRLLITPRSSLPLDAAADLPGKAFTPVSGEWFGVGDAGALSGNGFIEVRAPLPNTDQIEMSAPFTGPGVLGFHWRRAEEYGGTSLQVRLNQQTAASLSTGTAWEPVAVLVPAGSHTIRWIVSSPGKLAGYLDAFSWQPAPTELSLANAADASGVTDWSAPAGQWFPIADAGLSADGVDAIATASLPVFNKALLQARCQGPGTLRYLIRGPLGGGSNQTSFSVNGLEYPAGNPDNTSGWQERTLYLAGSGPQQLEWSLTSTSQFQLLTLYLDQVSFTPGTTGPALATALDQPGWTFRTGGRRPWQGVSTPAGRGGHMAAVAMLESEAGEGSWIETTLTGPGFLRPTMTAPAPAYIGLSMDGFISIYNVNQGFTVPAGSHTLRWTTYQSPPTPGPRNVTFTLDALEWYPGTWAGWQLHRFQGSGLAAALQGPAADPDADGHSNMLEAVLGTHPLVADAGAPLEVNPGSSANSRNLEFRCAPMFPAEFNATLESAPSLTGPWSTISQATPQDGSWNSSFYSVGPVSGSSRNRITGSVYLNPQERTRFWRIKVVKP